VAVHGTEVLWPRLGYRPHPEVALPESYGARAVYMSMDLRPGSGPLPADVPPAADARDF
jgi:hypothetical protein